MDFLEKIERALEDVLPAAETRPVVLSQAMRYAVASGGKRLRPQICLAAAEAVGGCADEALFPACAIELLHSYTLVHDDLPAMDNDRERRGKPSVWVKFGEATAILVGDALQALAFATAARAPRNTGTILAELGRRGVGVVQGQAEELASTADTRNLVVDFIFEHKTADLFMAAACMGGLAGGASPEQVERLRNYAFHLGLAFQHEDDLLDGDSPVGAEEARRLVNEHTAAAIAALEGLPGPTDFLSSLASRLVGRQV